MSLLRAGCGRWRDLRAAQSSSSRRRLAFPGSQHCASAPFVPVQYGLYSSFMGCFVYCILGTAKDVTLGPTAIMSLLVSSYAFHEPVYAILLAFLSGCIQLAMGLLHLGEMLLPCMVVFLGYRCTSCSCSPHLLCSPRHWGCPANACDSSVCMQTPCAPHWGRQRAYCRPFHAGFLLDFISSPVIKGFTSAASITISFNQVKVGPAGLLWMPCPLSPGAGCAAELGYLVPGWAMFLV